jgi:hypothetical protein
VHQEVAVVPAKPLFIHRIPPKAHRLSTRCPYSSAIVHTSCHLVGNGRCRGYGGWFSKALTEIPSHGSFIIPNGVPQRSGIFSTTKNPDIPNDIDCICRPREREHVKGSRLVVADQSCDGLQAYSASLDERVTLTAIFNSGSR